MHLTIFQTPITKQFMNLCSWLYLKLIGWKLEGTVPEQSKYIVLAGPHTSNWDFPLMLTMGSLLGAKPYWMGKKAIFKFPLGWFFKWMGGIPIDRSKKNSLVSQMVDIFDSTEELCVLIPPEGSRAPRKEWKTGFYHIARQANIPIVLSYIDFEKRVGGFAEVLWLTDDVVADMTYIQNFYAGKHPKYPERFEGEYINVDNQDSNVE